MRIYILVILMVFAFAGDSYAAHVIGGEMFYEYVGPGSNANTLRWRVTLRLFRDAQNCTPANNCADLPASVPIAFYNNDNNSIVGGVLNVVRTNYVPILPIVSSPSCLNPVPSFMYEEGDYSTVIDLPINTSGYTVNYQTCCRVAGIINIGNNDKAGSGYPTIIPGSSTMPVRGFDNCPRFQTGISILCYNKPFNLNFSAIDPDGDSLSYALIDALSGGAAVDAGFANPSSPPYSSVSYVSPYGGLNPFGSPISINPSTGIISGTAPGAGKYIVSVAVKSYRDGNYISMHRKDFIVTVAPCDFPSVKLDPVYKSCDGFTWNFHNEVFSPLNVNFFWDFGDGNTYTGNTDAVSHTYTTAGDYIIKLVVNPGTACADSATSLLKVYPGFFPKILAADSVCKNSPVQFNDGTSLNYGAVNYWKWDFGVTSTLADTSRIKNPTYSYPTPGTYDVTLIVKSNKGCEDTIVKPITIMDKAILNVTNDTLICNIDTLQLHVTSSSGGAGNYSWSPNYMINNTGIPNPLVSPDVTTTYYINYADSYGCTGRDSVRVSVVNEVTLVPAKDTTICLTDSVRLGISSNATGYIWSPGATLSNITVQNPYATPVAPTTTYHVIATIGKCLKEDDVTIKTVPYPRAAIGADTAICFGKSVQLQAAGGSSFKWSPPSFLTNPNIRNPISVSPQYSINYVVAVTDTFGCPKPDFDTIRITVMRTTATGLPSDTSVVAGQPLQLYIHGGTHYQWSPNTWLNNDTIYNPVSMPQGNITYSVVTSNNFGCTDRDTIRVKYYILEPDLYVPSAFTPGSDKLNDIFRPLALGIKKLDYFRVYNRWGEMVYATESLGQGWDGVYKGKNQDMGTYVWQAQAVDYRGKTIFRKGTVILIR